VLECIMRTGSILFSVSLISALLIAPLSARPLSIQRPVLRGIAVAGTQTATFHEAYSWPNRWRHRPGWTWHRYDRRIDRAWDNQLTSWAPVIAGSYGSVYGVGPDAPYSGSAIYYPLGTKKQKSHSENDNGTRSSAGNDRLPKVVYGITPETSATYPSVLFRTMPDEH